MNKELNIKDQEIQDKDQKIIKLEDTLTRLFGSTSWRLTSVLRGIRSIVLKSFNMLRELGRLKSKKNIKLIMTLLVRDEEDIIEKNIRFHLNHGVDFIVATDNGSVDGTRNILMEYEKKGRLHLIDEKKQDYSQAEWVNKMGKLAYKKYNADIIFHCDADEFWFPKSGNLKNEIIEKENADGLTVNLVNVILEENQGTETFPDDSKWAVVNPYEAQNYEEDTKNKNLYLFRYPQKVIYKTNKGYLDVSYGNHSVVATNEINMNKSKDIIIYHYPIRSRNQFIQKIKNGGGAFALKVKLDKGTCFHWRRWFESYKNNRLEDEYSKLILKEKDVVKLKKRNIIQKISFKDMFR